MRLVNYSIMFVSYIFASTFMSGIENTKIAGICMEIAFINTFHPGHIHVKLTKHQRLYRWRKWRQLHRDNCACGNREHASVKVTETHYIGLLQSMEVENSDAFEKLHARKMSKSKSPQ